jgi:hypothetical protein
MSELALDFETLPFGPSNLAPRPICVSVDDGDGNGLVVASCEPDFEPLIEHALKSSMLVTANGCFDLCVILAHLPQLSDLVWDALLQDRVTDVQIREKLLVLADTGDLEFAFLPNGAKKKLLYSLAALEQKYLGVDRTADKEDEDSWRSNYSALEGVPASDYPADAYEYSLLDSRYCLEVFKHQQKTDNPMALRTQFLRMRMSVALQLNSCWGFPIDRQKVEKMTSELGEKFDEKNFDRLVKSGILRPSEPAVPYTRQHARAVEVLGEEPMDWAPHVERLQALGIKFKQPKAASYNTTMLRELVKQTSEAFDIPIRWTDNEDNPQVSYSEEVQVDLEGLDPTFDQFIERNKIQKLVTTELPRMAQADRVHPKYNVMVRTGRTSSFGNRKTDKDPPYPAVNIQQIDPRIRPAYIADQGRVICSIDYSFIELVSAAQRCFSLFGQSKLRDLINAGSDPHAYLGAVIAREMDPERRYQWPDSPDDAYKAFVALKKTDNDYYKHFRGLAKPTGLGFPGGLGARTFVGYAKKTFGVDLLKIAGSMEAAFEMARHLKDIWLDLFPEFRAYFEWVTTQCVDVEWSTPEDRRYQYSTRKGLIRRNCVYTAATNGCALQSDTAEGAGISLFSLALAMHDSRLQSPLLGCHQLAFVHDEVLLDFPEDAYMHDRAYAAADLMVAGMREVMPDVTVTANPCLMRVWDKRAEPVFDNNKRLTIWTPN